jgi:hypothetical protein
VGKQAAWVAEVGRSCWDDPGQLAEMCTYWGMCLAGCQHVAPAEQLQPTVLFSMAAGLLETCLLLKPVLGQLHARMASASCITCQTEAVATRAACKALFDAAG